MARPRKSKIDHRDRSFIEAAIRGFEAARAEIDEKIASLKAMIGKGIKNVVEAVSPTPPKKRRLSAKARRAISLAQKKRWSAERAAKKAPAKKAVKEKPAKARKRKPRTKTNGKDVKVVGQLAPF